MSGGTKMTLHRYGGRVQDWKDQLIIVDQNYLDTHGNSPIISLAYPYDVDNVLLEVYFNGQQMYPGAGYTTIDTQTIQLDLGVDDFGNPIGLEKDDVIYIKFWQNHYYNRGGELPSPTQVNDIMKEIEAIYYGGASNVDFDYEYDDKGNIIREIGTGDYKITREFTYNSVNEIDSETIYFKDRIIRKTYIYDFSNDKVRLLKTTVRVLK
jgi:hypothetical protein